MVAFDAAHGAAAHDEAEAAINRLLCERAERVVVAADSSKLGQRAFARICAVESVDTLVTDTTAGGGHGAAVRGGRRAGGHRLRGTGGRRLQTCAWSPPADVRAVTA
ncbi:hypothetical protein BIV24_07985 [Streptomyces colonosanans]|uniref:DeoR-like transcriptional repressor C-terminal sensor domain-containing protein n=1 Tax=Streptomyces colonosanans TaxID=1428652 RepID=A0A1S2PR38_9ACTN|nr:hypothetical protein BIV24_07985 [Streptomyces colonosanans]